MGEAKAHVAKEEVEIPARPETVFGCFEDEATFSSWLGARMGVATIEPRLGGALEVAYGGGFKTAGGEILAWDPAERFSFTWGYEDGKPFARGSTRVDLHLVPTGTATRLTLRHSGLPSEAAARDHASGWRLCLGILADLSAKAEHAGRLEALVGDWFAAWAATDEEERLGCIARIMTKDGTFRHPMALAVGPDALSDHIASSQRHMQGMSLEAHGPVEQVHAHLRFAWKVVRDGQTLATGENVATLSPDGRMSEVVGFTDPGAH